MRTYLGILLVFLLAAFPAHAFNSNTPGGSGIAGGTCTGGQVMGGITSAGVPQCVTPASAGSYPAGSPPQVGGFSALNVAEAETVSGDFTYARGGANSYVATVTKLNGIAVGALATLNVGTGLTSSAGSLSLTVPVAIVNGGTGSTAAPVVGQIPIATTTSVFTPTAISGDATLASTGALTVTKTGGVAFTGLATAAIPLSVANGGTGATTAGAALTSLGAAPIASPTFTGTVTIPAGASIAGYAPLASPVFTGTPSLPTGTTGITQTAGTNNTSIATTAFVAAAISAGTAGVTSFNTRTGAVVLTLPDVTGVGGAPAASPTFTGTISFPDGSTYSAAGHNSVKALGIGAAAGTVGSLMVPITTTTNQGLFFGPQTGTSSGGMVQATGTQSLAFGVGAHFDGTNWVADQTSAAFASMSLSPSAHVSLWQASGLTVGNTFTPTAIGQFYLGLQVGAPTGGDKGAGTINVAGGYYVNGVLIGAGGALPSGTAGQFVGYPATGTTGEAETLGGDATLARTGANAYSLTVTKTNGVALTGLATATIPLSIANGGTASSTAPSAGQLLIANSTTLYVPATMSGDCTIIAAGAITCTKINGVAGPFAPLTNPTNGQNNYAPLSSPTFSGTVTMPDASTITSAGHNNAKAIGIGVAASATAGSLLFMGNNFNGPAITQLTNTTAGTSAVAYSYWINDQSHYAAIGLSSSLFTGGGSVAPADSENIQTSGTNGINLSTSLTTAPIAFWIGGTKQGAFTTNGLVLQGTQPLGVVAPWTPTIIGSATNPTVTYTTQTGRITYIGNIFLWDFFVGWSALSGGSGFAEIAGLPVTTGATAYFGGAAWNFSGIATAPVSGNTAVGCQIAPSANIFTLSTSGIAAAGGNVSISNLGASGQILCQGWGSTV